VERFVARDIQRTAYNHFAIAGSTIAPDSGNEAGVVMKFPRTENGGNFCSFFKPQEKPFTSFFVQPMPDCSEGPGH
jgi:hypothetical protein